MLDPTTGSKEKQNSNQIYERLYLDFNEQKYIQVIDESNKYILDFNGESIVPKLEFLKALAVARVYGFKEYERALTFIKLNYSTTVEGKEAELILDEGDPFSKIKLDKSISILFIS